MVAYPPMATMERRIEGWLQVAEPPGGSLAVPRRGSPPGSYLAHRGMPSATLLQSPQQGGGVAKKKKKSDQQQELDRALRNEEREDLVGDMEEDRNLTGSTTWETLPGQHDDVDQQRGRRRKGANPRIKSYDVSKQRQNPPYTTKGPITVPKFGSAGSGGLENEPGPEE